MAERAKTILYVALVILGFVLAIPWWGFMGWAVLRLVRVL